jgi:hypothetical protein
VTKADVIAEISSKTGIDKKDVSETLENFFQVVKDNLEVLSIKKGLEKLLEIFQKILRSPLRSTMYLALNQLRFL